MDPRTDDNARRLRRIGVATAIALAAAILILFAVVLPAEYGRDPLGTGELLGLRQLSGDRKPPIVEQFSNHRTDYAEFVLEPFQSLEYKYLMDRDAALIYSWQASGPLYFDLHADPAGELASDEESYAAGEDRQAQRGVYQARFNGLHGWFWENRSFEEVTIRLQTAGFYVNATVFQDGGTFEREPESVLSSDTEAEAAGTPDR